MQKFAALALAVLALLVSACGGSSPESSLNRFVGAINDADFNDAYQELTPACHESMTAEEFESIYGTILLETGIGLGGLVGTTLEAEDVEVTRVSDREATITLDWILFSSLDNPLPFFGNIADSRVPLSTVTDTAGTENHPLFVLDLTGSGDWRLDDCDPMGLVKYSQDVQDFYDDLEYYYGY